MIDENWERKLILLHRNNILLLKFKHVKYIYAII